ncbi:MAG: peptidylprolyl isomerase [Propionibacteriaceae bacterium]|nr:peptidylprolyl isomerase [Propionibacteriaceae bacterium]
MRYVPLLAGSLLLLAGCVSPSQPGYTVDDQPSADTSPAQAGACEYPSDGQAAKPVNPPSTTDVKTEGEAVATLHLTAGDVEITLDRATAPCTVNSFESLAKQGYFDDTACHRLTTDGIYVLQCGDPSATGSGGPGYSFADETNESMSYPPGTVAMANAGPDTNGSQFFLVWADSSQLPPDYTVFGMMDEAGLEVVAGIAAEGVALEDQTSPNAEAIIESVTLG